jgi:hypothetical protein
MHEQILVIDNFLDNPDEIRQLALFYQYLTPTVNDGWKGYRSINWCENYSPYQDISKKIKRKVCEHFKLDQKDLKIKCCFHYCLESTKNTCIPSFEEYKFHIDPFLISGVIYLTPNPPPNSGTEFLDFKVRKVDNVYNRLVSYPSNIVHAPENLFGYDIMSSRITITFFLDKHGYSNYW